MTQLIAKIFGFHPEHPSKKDDFSLFFESKAHEKAKVIRQILKEATKEQEQTVQKYRENKLLEIA